MTLITGPLRSQPAVRVYVGFARIGKFRHRNGSGRAGTANPMHGDQGQLRSTLGVRLITMTRKLSKGGFHVHA